MPKKKQNLEQKVDDLTEKADFIVEYLKDNVATKSDLKRVEERVGKLETKVTKIEATMVTKDYLDEKMADMRGGLVVLMRKEDVKVKTLVEILRKKNLLSADEVNSILKMEPFPQLA